MKHTTDPGVSKFIHLTTDHHTRLTMFKHPPQIQSQLCHWVEHYLEKKVDGSGNSLPSPQSSYATHIVGIAGDSEMNMSLTQLKAVGGAGTQGTPGICHRPSPGGTYVS